MIPSLTLWHLSQCIVPPSEKITTPEIVNFLQSFWGCGTLCRKCSRLCVLYTKITNHAKRILRGYEGNLALRYPIDKLLLDNTRKEISIMSAKNTNKLNVPEARAAMDKFKMEAANEEDVYQPQRIFPTLDFWLKYRKNRLSQKNQFLRWKHLA
jgi:hypothetical protein